MRPKIQVAAVLAAAVFAGGADAHAQGAPAGAPTVAVLEFDYGAVRAQWPATGGWRRTQAIPAIDTLGVGKGIANLLVADLATGGGLRLVERLREADVARERLRRRSAYVDLSYRVVDAATGEIVGAANAAGTSQRRGVLLGGLGGGIGGGLSVGSAEFQNDDSRRGNRRSRKRCRREIANSAGGRILIGEG